MLDSETYCAGQPARGGKICAAVDCVYLIDTHQPFLFFFSTKVAFECVRLSEY